MLTSVAEGFKRSSCCKVDSRRMQSVARLCASRVTRAVVSVQGRGRTTLCYWMLLRPATAAAAACRSS